MGKEKLATRLRQRGENISMMTMTDREMVDTELLTFKEDLENQDCLSHMEDLQVSGDLWLLVPCVRFTTSRDGYNFIQIKPHAKKSKSID